MKYVLMILMVLSSSSFWAQNTGPAIGQWKTFLSYYVGMSCDYDDEQIFVGTQTGLFTYHLEDGLIETYSKVNGMHDIGIVKVHYNQPTRQLIIAYQNGNIDVFNTERKFINIPDFMISTLPGDKVINSISSEGHVAYLSTSMGLVSLDLDKYEIKGTTQFYNGATKANVLSNAIVGDTIYVSTDIGLFKSFIHQPYFQDYTSWEKISSKTFTQIVPGDNLIFGLKDGVFVDSIVKILADNTEQYVFKTEVHIGSISSDRNGGLFLTTNYSSAGMGSVMQISSSGEATPLSQCVFGHDVIKPNSTQVFFVDEAESSYWGGLRLVNSLTSTSGLNPNGPESKFAFDVSVRNGEIWLAHGAHNSTNWHSSNKKSYFSSYINNTWKNYAPQIESQGWDYISDASRILKNFNNGHVYVGLANGGLIDMNSAGEMTLYRNPELDGAFGDTSMYIVSGLAIDKANNLWFNNYAGAQELKVLTPTGELHGFHSMYNTTQYAVDVIVDDYGSKWYYSTFDGGLYVYNDNNTLTNTSDDRTNVFRMGKELGNLPSNTVLSLAKDRSGTIWVGTNNGIGIFNAPKDALEGVGNDTAELRVVKYDGDFDAKRLFTGQSVTAIAVDGDNRKWIGTSNNGVFLISADAQTMIHHFTSSNSPLLDNEILRIQIDPVTGDVYFCTVHGLIAYRGTSTEPKPTVSEDLLVYPNPVPSGYEGYIAIKDLQSRCDVRITDVNGYLIAHFETNGGEAVWDGKDYNGRRPQSGVYLVFITDRLTGKMIKSGKLIFEH